MSRKNFPDTRHSQGNLNKLVNFSSHSSEDNQSQTDLQQNYHQPQEDFHNVMTYQHEELASRQILNDNQITLTTQTQQQQRQKEVLNSFKQLTINTTPDNQQKLNTQINSPIHKSINTCQKPVYTTKISPFSTEVSNVQYPKQFKFKDQNSNHKIEQQTHLNTQENEQIIQKKAGEKIQKAKIMYIMEKVRQVFFHHLSNTQSRRFRSLQEKHYEMIDDQACDMAELFKITENQSLIGQFQYQITECLRAFNVCFRRSILSCMKKDNPFNPMQKILQLASWVEVCNILWMIFTFSLFIFYGFDDRDYLDTCLIASLFITIIGSFIRLNSGYYEHGKWISDPEKRLQRYFRDYFGSDLVGFFTILYCLLDQGGSYQKILAMPIFYRVKTLRSLVKEQEEIWNFSGTIYYIKGLFILFFWVISVCHIIGILYHTLAIWENDYLDIDNNWMQVLGVYDEHWSLRYAESFYWSLATIMLVGSKGETLLEIIFCCLTLLTTVGMFATILSKITQLIEEMDKSTKEYREEVDVLNKMFDQNQNISKDTQLQVLNYLKYLNIGHEDMQTSERVSGILNKFPQDIQTTLRYEKYKQHLDKLDFLSNFSSETIEKVLGIVEEQYYMPNQIIVNEMDFNQPQIYLIMKGGTVIQQETDSKLINLDYLKEGKHYGLKYFFTDIVDKYIFRSTDFTTILTLPRQDFMEILNSAQSRHDIEIYHKIRHQIMASGLSNQLLKQQCIICHKNDHRQQDCNLIHYVPSKNNLILKCNKSEPQKRRNEFKKRRMVKVNPKTNLEVIQDRKTIILENTEMRTYLKQLQQELKESEEKIEEMFNVFPEKQRGDDEDNEGKRQKSKTHMNSSLGNSDAMKSPKDSAQDPYTMRNVKGGGNMEYEDDYPDNEVPYYMDSQQDISSYGSEEEYDENLFTEQSEYIKNNNMSCSAQVKASPRSLQPGEYQAMNSSAQSRSSMKSTPKRGSLMPYFSSQKDKQIRRQSMRMQQENISANILIQQQNQQLHNQAVQPQNNTNENEKRQSQGEQFKITVNPPQAKKSIKGFGSMLNNFAFQQKSMYEKLELKKLLQENKDFTYFLEFEQQQSYTYFFPDCNFERIFAKYKEYLAKQQNQQRIMDKMKRKLQKKKQNRGNAKTTIQKSPQNLGKRKSRKESSKLQQLGNIQISPKMDFSKLVPQAKQSQNQQQ